MNSPYLNKKEIAEIFRVSPATAQAYLAKRGVLPIKIGGKTSPLLWDRQDVMTVLDILRTESRAPSPEYVKPRRNDLRIIGKSAADVYAMVTQ